MQGSILQPALSKPVRSLYLPGLLSCRTWPLQATHVANRVVGLGEGLQDTEHGVGHHDEQRQHPGGGDDTVRMRPSLPRAGLERIADGAVTLIGDGHQAEGGDAD